ncbi:MAG: ABC transporter permease [Syntrophotalea sp.]|uniref:ABC transporter permease n=1 Tax=Syntrophotalea sp. TaxID=2812029 RepID=UPI003D122172
MFDRVYKYKDLLAVFAWREFIIRYKQTFFGVSWALFQPLSMMLLFVLVFGYILKVDSKGIPYPLFFLSGLLPWTLFSNSTNYAIPSLTNHYSLITKIYFPREIIPLSGIIVFLVDFMISFLLYILIVVIYGYEVTKIYFCLIPIFFIMIVFIISVGLCLSSLNVYYRDVKLASSFILQILFFATPVFYTVNDIDTKLKFIIYLNPLTFVIESFRNVTINGVLPNLFTTIIVFILVLLFFIFSYKLFVRMEKAFADVI